MGLTHFIRSVLDQRPVKTGWLLLKTMASLCCLQMYNVVSLWSMSHVYTTPQRGHWTVHHKMWHIYPLSFTTVLFGSIFSSFWKLFFQNYCLELSTENMELSYSHHEMISSVSTALVCFFFRREGRMTTESVMTRFHKSLSSLFDLIKISENDSLSRLQTGKWDAPGAKCFLLVVPHWVELEHGIVCTPCALTARQWLQGFQSVFFFSRSKRRSILSCHHKKRQTSHKPWLYKTMFYNSDLKSVGKFFHSC